MPLDTYRLCRAGNHSQCLPNVCNKRKELEDQARETLYARLILDWMKAKNIPWSKLGKDEAPMRKAARWKMSKYPWLESEYQPGLTERIEAKYWAQDIIAGQVEYFPSRTSEHDKEDPDNTDYWS